MTVTPTVEKRAVILKKLGTGAPAAYTQAARNTSSCVSDTEHPLRFIDGVAVFGRQAGVDLSYVNASNRSPETNARPTTIKAAACQ